MCVKAESPTTAAPSTSPAIAVPEDRRQGRGFHQRAAAATSLPHALVRPLIAIPPPPLRNASGVPSEPAAAAPLASPPVIPAIIRPVIRMPVMGPTASAPPPVASQQIIRPQLVTISHQAPKAGQQDMSTAGGVVTHHAPSSSSAPAAPSAPTMSALAAVKMARRLAAEEQRRRAEEAAEDRECVVCLERAMNTVLQPCGHRQMCSRCCREHLALAESRQAEPLVGARPGGGMARAGHTL